MLEYVRRLMADGPWKPAALAPASRRPAKAPAAKAPVEAAGDEQA